MKLSELVKDNHDVYLTFSGTNKGYFGLADVAWFSFNAPGTAKLSPPMRAEATTQKTGDDPALKDSRSIYAYRY